MFLPNKGFYFKSHGHFYSKDAVGGKLVNMLNYAEPLLTISMLAAGLKQLCQSPIPVVSSVGFWEKF